MNNGTPIDIAYFSDALCVWAYTAQIRVDELKKQFGSRIKLSYHFIPVFGCTEQRIASTWRGKNGYLGYSRHVQQVCQQLQHVVVHPQIWQQNIPKSSASCHHFLKAVQLLEHLGDLSSQLDQQLNGHTLFEETMWRLRLAFFRDLRDVSTLDCQLDIATQLGLPVAKITALMNNGSAMAAMCRDAQLQEEYKVEGSPSYILNEGRQKLYGNVGYRIIEANVLEILERPENQASWC